MRLSSTTLPVSTYLLDYGNTTGNGIATHSLTLYRAPSGALVFGAGTVYWSWGLSDNHDKEVTPTDPRVQQAMVNLFADMGIQPGTLQSGLITGLPSTDHTAPTSVFNAPASVNAGDSRHDFRHRLGRRRRDRRRRGLDRQRCQLASGNRRRDVDIYLVAAGCRHLYDPLPRRRRQHQSGNALGRAHGHRHGPSYVSLFSGSATPAVVNTTDASAVELGVKFQSSVAGTVSGIRFYKSSQDTGVHTGELWSSTGTKLATLTFTNETASGWQTATFSSPVTMTPGATYTASYHTNVGHYSNTDNYFTVECDERSADRACRRQRRLRLRQHQPVPDEHLPGDEFLGRRHVQPVDGDRQQPPVAVDDLGPCRDARHAR